METLTWLISIKFILECKRKIFCKKYEGLIRSSVLENVRKILDCWTNLWYTSYKCKDCGEIKHINFTCKSRFCNSCSKPQSDLRIDKIFSRLPRWIWYHHIILTIPEESRDFFKRHRKALSILPKIASDSVRYFLKNDQKIIPWIIAVIHTFWSKLNRNPHVHLLITHWWYSTKHKTFIKDRFFLPYKAIRIARTKQLIKHLKIWVKQNLAWEAVRAEISFLDKFYDYKNKEGKPTSWYGFFSQQRLGFESIITYIWRYIKKPVIAQSRILDYDWENVIFNFKDKTENNKIKEITCTDIEFLELLVQHIPNKHAHMIYYSGIFANRIKAKYLKIINALYPSNRCFPRVPQNFRSRLAMLTDRDPLKCFCGWWMCKYKRFIPWYKPYFYDPP